MSPWISMASLMLPMRSAGTSRYATSLAIDVEMGMKMFLLVLLIGSAWFITAAANPLEGFVYGLIFALSMRLSMHLFLLMRFGEEQLLSGLAAYEEPEDEENGR